LNAGQIGEYLRRESACAREGAHHGAADDSFRCEDQQLAHITETRPPGI